MINIFTLLIFRFLI